MIIRTEFRPEGQMSGVLVGFDLTYTLRSQIECKKKVRLKGQYFPNHFFIAALENVERDNITLKEYEEIIPISLY